MCKNELKLTNVKSTQMFLLCAELLIEEAKERLNFCLSSYIRNRILLVESFPNLVNKLIIKSKDKRLR